jgi:hypothetical protein
VVTPPFAWLFNLDAEEELRHPGRHSRSPQMQQRLQRVAASLQGFVAPGDVVVTDDTPRLTGDFIAQPWCPTPTARDRLREVGALLPDFPAVDILRRVNHRAFNASLGQTLPGAIWVRDSLQLEEVAAQHPDVVWLLKRPFGFSGRHRLRCRLPARQQHEHRWIEASLRRGDGLQVEPWVQRQLDCVVHGWCDAAGDVRLGDVAVQECDAQGAWQRTRLAAPGDLSQGEADAVRQAAHEVAEALVTTGYFGPFGVDSFRWQEAAGPVHWNARSDINARYTMGWFIGMRGWRPRLSARRGL